MAINFERETRLIETTGLGGTLFSEKPWVDPKTNLEQYQAVGSFEAVAVVTKCHPRSVQPFTMVGYGRIEQVKE